MLTTVLDQEVKEMLDQSREMDTLKADWNGAHADFHFNNQSEMVMPATGGALTAPFCVNDWAMRQLMLKLGPAVFGKSAQKSLPFDYLMAISPEIRADLLNRHLGNMPNGSGRFMVRTYDNTVRAVLSEDYTPIANTELLEMVQSVIETEKATGVKTVRPFLTPDSLSLRTVWRNINRGGGSWGIGVYISNGEIGNNRLRMYPLLQRHSCTNSIIVESGKGVEFIHRGSRAAKMVIMRSVMAEMFPLAAQALEKMIEAEAEQLPSFMSVLDGLATRYEWSDEVKLNVALGSEGRQTRAGLVNGVTYAAHASRMSTEEAEKMEILGGSLLVAPGSLFASAARSVEVRR